MSRQIDQYMTVSQKDIGRNTSAAKHQLLLDSCYSRVVTQEQTYQSMHCLDWLLEGVWLNTPHLDRGVPGIVQQQQASKRLHQELNEAVENNSRGQLQANLKSDVYWGHVLTPLLLCIGLNHLFQIIKKKMLCIPNTLWISHRKLSIPRLYMYTKWKVGGQRLVCVRATIWD